tara:strand:+ start:908 stop:1339 length:432 start_codon:yes stop_codon:yes gene_type:complete
MARVTVEDCILKVSNRFQLVMMAAQRSRVLSVGGELTVERDNDKNPVVALREIAEETIPLEELENDVIEGLQRNIDVDEPIEADDDEVLDVAEALNELAALADGDEAVRVAEAVRPKVASDDPMSGMISGFEDVTIEDVKKED